MRRNKLVTMLLALSVIGCQGLPKGVDKSPLCKYNVSGLSCKREQVWQMRSDSTPFEVDKTRYVFQEYADCMKFIEDENNRPLLNLSEVGYVSSCGANGNTGTSADVTNFYIYSDGSPDTGEYLMLSDITIKYQEPDEFEPWGYSETFNALFTSQKALEAFMQDYSRLDREIKYPSKIKVQRLYNQEAVKNIKVPTLEALAQKLDHELATARNPLQTLGAFHEYFADTKGRKVLYARSISAQGDNSREEKRFQTISLALSQDLPVDKNCLLGDNFSYVDKSDACIIARRNSALKPTDVGYFNYKKYLPQNTAIKNDKQFIDLYDAYVNIMITDIISSYSYIVREKYNRDCEAAAELTRSEKIRCEQDKADFIMALSQGKAKKCKDIVAQKYARFKKHEIYNASNYSAARNKQENNEKLQTFGYVNLCVPDYIK